MLICFYGDHTHMRTHIHTRFCLACPSTFSCLEQTGSSQIKLDRTEFGRRAKRETSLIFIFLIVCLRYSGILNSRFLLLGPFLFFLFLGGGTSWFCSSLGSELDFGDRTGPDRLVRTAYERKI